MYAKLCSGSLMISKHQHLELLSMVTLHSPAQMHSGSNVKAKMCNCNLNQPNERSGVGIRGLDKYLK